MSLKKKAVALCCALTLATSMVPAVALAEVGAEPVSESEVLSTTVDRTNSYDIKDAVVHSVSIDTPLISPFYLDGEDIDATDRQLYEFICSEIQRHTEKIDVSSYIVTVGELRNVMDLVFCNSELWWARSAYELGYYTGTSAIDDRQAAHVKPEYLFTAAEVESVKPEVEASISAALAWADEADSTFEKVQALHDYLVRTCRYSPVVEADSNAPSEPINHSAAGALSGDRIIVCQGYALAYKLLLGRAGIDALYITSEEMNHGWNMVELDGSWYHVDVTWDDPTNKPKGKEVLYNYFLKSDSTFVALNHHDWSSLYNAGSDYLYSEDELKVYSCDTCGHWAGEPEKKNMKAATCTAGGSYTETKACAACQTVISTRTVEVPAVGHAYGIFVSNGDSKVGVEGTKTATCARCGDKITAVDIGSALPQPSTSSSGGAVSGAGSAGKPSAVGSNSVSGATAAAGSTAATAVKAPVLKKLAKPTVKSSKKKQLTVTWKKGATVTWNKVKYAPKAYVVQYSTDAKFKKGVKKTTVKVTKALAKKSKLTTTLKKSLVSKKTYYVRVAAQYKIGGKTYTSPYAVSKKVKVK